MLKFFVGEPRAEQREAAEELADSFNDYDVFVLQLPVATGKSKLAEMIARFAAAARGGMDSKAAIVTNNNMLLDQYLATLGGGFRTIHAKHAYACHEGGWSCAERAAKIGGHCRSVSGSRYAKDACPYLRDLGGSRGADKLVLNQHALLAHKLQRPVMVYDEAHSLINTIQELACKRLWRREYGWRRTLTKLDDVREWLATRTGPRDELAELLASVLDGSTRGYSIWLGEEDWRGTPHEVIKLIAIDVRDQPPHFWPESKTQKVVLMSATISHLDVEALGLANRRVKYIATGSPIPPDRRPFVHHPVADLSWRGRSDGIEDLASFLEYELLPQHAGERGLVHAPYSVASELARLMVGHPRLIFHDQLSKRVTVDDWLSNLIPGDDRVLVGSGMHEGLDLAGDRARFQVLTATPRKSIEDPGLLWLAETQPELYEWITIRDIAQAYGRVSRSPDDYGVTISVDASSARELASPQVPAWLREAFVPAGD